MNYKNYLSGVELTINDIYNFSDYIEEIEKSFKLYNRKKSKPYNCFSLWLVEIKRPLNHYTSSFDMLTETVLVSEFFLKFFSILEKIDVILEMNTNQPIESYFKNYLVFITEFSNFIKIRLL